MKVVFKKADNKEILTTYENISYIKEDEIKSTIELLEYENESKVEVSYIEN